MIISPTPVRHCPLCGTFHDIMDLCPDLFRDNAIIAADAADQARWERQAGQR